MDQRLSLGRWFGIDLFVHWSFALLLVYVGYSTAAEGGSQTMVLFSVAQLLAVFVCVVLHEYGHCLAARRFGVGTFDITLYPIGGVARLKRIPREPIQEFVIAVAGPAVNVVIAFCLSLLIVVVYGRSVWIEIAQWLWGMFVGNVDQGNVQTVESSVAEPSWLTFIVTLLAINLLLVVFNMVPAFPMDGGRVLRSLLAVKLPYVTATRWAQRIGVVCAILMATFAVRSDPPRLVMLLIAGFIVYAGLMEARYVELSDRLQSLLVRDVMTGQPPSLSMNTTLDDAQGWWRDQTITSAAVVGLGDIVVGVISLADIARHLREPNSRRDSRPPLGGEITVGQLTDHEAPTVEPNVLLESIIGGFRDYRQVPVVDAQHRLVGWLDFDSMLPRSTLARARLPFTTPELAAEAVVD